MVESAAPSPDDLLQHALFVRTVAAAALRGDDRVDDVVQDTWVAALESRTKRRGPLRAWLAGVARRKAVDVVRQESARRRREGAVPVRGPTSVSDVAARAEIGRRLAEAVLGLDEPYRTAVLLRYYDGLPPREIAPRLGLPLGTVKTHLKRGLAALRARLEAEFGATAEGWRTALLPLVGAGAPSGATIPLLTAGVGLMAKKVAVVAVGLLLLGFLAVGWVRWNAAQRGGDGDGAPPADAELVADARGDGAEPNLGGRADATQGDSDETAARGTGHSVVTGAVIDEDGKPLAGVVVRATRAPLEGAVTLAGAPPLDAPPVQNEILNETTTTEDGRFRLAGLPAGAYVRFSAHPGEGWWGGSTTREMYWVDTRIVLVAGRGTEVQGRVVDGDGRGIRAWVGAMQSMAGDSTRAWSGRWRVRALATDAGGVFRIPCVPRGEVLFSAVVPGRTARYWTLVDVPTREEVVLRLEERGGAALEGTVRDEDGGAVAGARIRVTSMATLGLVRHEQTARQVSSDDQGRYRIDALLPGHLQEVLVEAEGYAAWGQSGRQLPLAAGEVASFDITLRCGVHVPGPPLDLQGRPIVDVDVRGRVLLDGGLPPPGTIVWAIPDRRRGQGTAGSARAQAFCDPEGSFVVRCHTGAPVWLLRAQAPGLASLWREVSPAPAEGGQGEDIELDLAPTHALYGTVLDPDGAPFAGVAVRGESTDHEPWWTSSALDGGFHVADLSPATYRVFAVDHNGRQLGESQEVRVVGDAPPDAVVLRLPEVYRLGGVVVRPDGEPIAGAKVDVSTDGERTPYTYTDRDGYFEFVLYHDTERVLEVWDRVQHVKIPDLYRPGRTDYRIVVTGERPQMATVEFTLHGPDGRKAAGGYVMIRTGRNDSGRRYSGRGARFAGGRIFSELKIGVRDFDLDVKSLVDEVGRRMNVLPRYVKDLRAKDSPFTIRLERGHVLEGRVVDAAGQGIVGLEVFVGTERDLSGHHWGSSLSNHHVVRTATNGSFRAVGLPDGALAVAVGPSKEWVQPSAQVVAAGRDEVVIALEEGAEISGRVLGPDGEPLLYAQVRAMLPDDVRSAYPERPLAPTFVRRGWWTSTDAGGAFRLTGLPSGARVRLEVKPPAPHASRTVPDVAAGTTDLVLRTEPGAFITGEVVGDGWDDVGGLEVQACRPAGERSLLGPRPAAEATLDRGERAFEIGPLPRGRYIVLVRTENWSKELVRQDDVPAPSKGLRLSLPPAFHVRGHLIGRDLGGFQVHFRNASGEGLGTTVDETGRFLFPGTRNERGTFYATRDGDDRCAFLEDVQTGEGPLAVRLEEGRVLTGRVEGIPADHDAPIRVTVNAPPIQKRGEADADGTFRIGGLPPGKYDVWVRLALPHGFLRAKGVEPGGEPLVLRYDPK